MGDDSWVPPLSRRVPGAADNSAQAAPPAPAQSLLSAQSLPQRMRDAADVADAVTTPIPAITCSVGSDIAGTAADEHSAQPDRAVHAPANHHPVTALRGRARRRAAKQAALQAAAARQAAAWQAPVQQAPAPRDASPQEAIPQEAIPQEVVQQEAVQQEAVQQEAVQQEAVQQEAVQQEAVQQEAVQQQAVQQEVVQQQAVQQEAVQQAAAPQEADHRVAGPQVRARGRYRKAGAVVSAMVLIAAGSLAFALSRPTSAATTLGGATRNMAAAWVAGQVSRTAVVSCDPVMCRALRAHGIPERDLLVLRPGTASPLGSDVVVATAAVRSQFGHRLSSVYAPAVIASFGSGNLRIEVRVIVPHGAAAYFAELSADLRARKASGAELLHNGLISASAAARRQLAAGQVDSRLLIALASMTAVHRLHIVAFGDSAPGIGASGPVRSAELSDIDGGHGASASAYARSMLAFLRVQQAPYRPAHAGTIQLADGKTVLRIEFDDPSPLGLLP